MSTLRPSNLPVTPTAVVVAQGFLRRGRASALAALRAWRPGGLGALRVWRPGGLAGLGAFLPPASRHPGRRFITM